MKKLLISAFVILSACSPAPIIEFINQPCLVPYQDNDFSLCRDFTLLVNDYRFTVPEGFVTDLASVPRILWPIYAPNDVKTIGPAIMHDYLYSCPGHRARRSIDAMFYSALIVSGNSVLTAYLYWVGVRLFGASHFREGYQCIYANNPK